MKVNGPLEIKYVARSGSGGFGTGVTRQFYTSVADALQEAPIVVAAESAVASLLEEEEGEEDPAAPDVLMWAHDVVGSPAGAAGDDTDGGGGATAADSSAAAQAGEVVSSQRGLFPQPLDPRHPRLGVVSARFTFAGRMVAAALRDSQTFPLPLSEAFLYLVQWMPHALPPDDAGVVSPVVASAGMGGALDSHAWSVQVQRALGRNVALPLPAERGGAVRALHEALCDPLDAADEALRCALAAAAAGSGAGAGAGHAAGAAGGGGGGGGAAAAAAETAAAEAAARETWRAAYAAVGAREFTKARLGQSYEYSLAGYLEMTELEQDPMPPLDNPTCSWSAPLGFKPEGDDGAAAVPPLLRLFARGAAAAAEAQEAEVLGEAPAGDGSAAEQEQRALRALLRCGRRFARACAARWLGPGVAAQVGAFRRGISEFFVPDALTPFAPSELRTMLTGRGAELPWTETELRACFRHTGFPERRRGRRHGEGSAGSRTLDLLIRWLLGATERQRRLFLIFVTAVPVLLPARRIDKIELQYEAHMEQSSTVTARTCMNRLHVREFRSLREMHDAFQRSFGWSRGFHDS